VFPVRYELNSYINLLRNSVFKGLIRVVPAPTLAPGLTDVYETSLGFSLHVDARGLF
jgi:hypothetical protein